MNDKIETFNALHVPGNPLILFNVWDAGSAVAVASAGAKAIATGSWGVAGSLGFTDGEALPIDLAIANLARIVAVTDVPVSIDMEAGYGESAADITASVGRAAAAGAAGINIEDKTPGTRTLHPIGEAAARIAAAASTGVFVNARCDHFILTPPADHDAAAVNAVIERAQAYASAGARGLFVPYLLDEALIARLCERSPLPVNILTGKDCPPHRRLAELGVARISHGHSPWAAAMAHTAAQARQAFAMEWESSVTV